VGKTASGVANSGAELQSSGFTSITRDGGPPLQLNRKTSDGSLVALKKDGTTVGGIYTFSNELALVSGNTGLYFDDANNKIFPLTGSGNVRDNITDLGASNARFKDLYLSGGVYLGGTGSANHLDSYEEGTWTCTLAGASGSTVSVSSQTYTKVGRMVYAAFDFYAKNISGTVGHLRLTGLPFASNTSRNSHMLIGISATNFDTAWGELGTNSTVIFLYRRSGNGGANFSALTDADWNNNGTSASIRGYIMYLAS
jgi:hypothetical protein